MTSAIVQLCGIFFGVLCRTIFPFLRKLYQGKIKSFNKKYLYQGIGAFFLSLIFSFLILPQYSLEAKEAVDLVNSLKLFCMAFAFGFGFNALINETGEWFKNGKKY
jgi:cytochrome c biogenesis factor